MKKKIICGICLTIILILLGHITFAYDPMEEIQPINDIVKIYSLSGEFITTYKGEISIKSNIKNTKADVVFTVDGKPRFVYNALVIIEKEKE